MSRIRWIWLFSSSAVIAVVGVLWASQSQAELSESDEDIRWSTDGREVIHERLPASSEISGGSSEFVYNPVDGKGLPSEIRRDGTRLSAPSVTMKPIDGEALHTREGLKDRPGGGSSVGAGEDGQPDAVTMDPRMSFTDRAQPDRTTQKEGKLDYQAVFDPSVVPFKRNHALNRVASDYELSVERGTLRTLEIKGNQVEAGREIFWGSILLEGDGENLIPIPSVSPDSHILSYQTTPRIGVTFYQDAGDNFYVRPDAAGLFRLVFVMDARSIYFGRSLPTGIRVGKTGGPTIPTVAANVSRSARRFNRALKLHARTDYKTAIDTLVRYFRSFEAGDPPPPRGDIFSDLAVGRKGICRHRSFAFMVAALELGVPTRYVANEAHIFVEVWVPGSTPGWMRIDLGGGAEELVVHNGQDKHRHRSGQADPFGGFNASNRTPTSLAGAEKVTGLPRQPSGAKKRNAPGETADALSKLTETVDNHIARPVDEPGAQRTQTSFEMRTAIVFRGDRVKAQGRVISATGEVVTIGIVQILLVDPASGRAIKQLATAPLDGNGLYQATVVFPREQATGSYEIIAEYMGGHGLASSTSD
jgi:hypothetical protein